MVRRLADSSNKFTVEDEKQLAHSGREEHRAIGARFSARFVKIFDAATARSDVEFISSDKSRTIDSCTSFKVSAVIIMVIIISYYYGYYY